MCRDCSRMTATDSAIHLEPAGQRFSDWLESAPIGRTAARELLTGLAIQPEKIRLPGISAAVAWLTPAQVVAMDQAAARVAAGESVAAVIAEAGDDDPTPAPVRKRSRPAADPSQLATLAAALASALQSGRDPSQPVAALPAITSPLARARALQEVARDGLMLTSAELAQITGLPVEGIEALRGGSRLHGYRLVRIRGSAADPSPLWRLTPPSAMDRD